MSTLDHKMHDIMKTLCIKLELANMTIWLNILRDKKNYIPPTICSIEFLFFHDNMKKFVLDWPLVPNTWPVKIGTNLLRKKVLALEYVGFQLQQRKALCSCRMFSKVAICPSLSCTSIILQIQTPIWKLVGQSNNTNGRSQNKCKSVGTHGHLLCGWTHYHSISRFWSNNHHYLQ